MSTKLAELVERWRQAKEAERSATADRLSAEAEIIDELGRALLDKGTLAEIAGVVVGDRQRGEVLFQQREAARVGQEVIRFFYALAFFGDDTFQITDGDIRVLEEGGKGLEWIDALGD